MAGQIIKRGDDTWVVRIFMGRDAQGQRRYMNKTIKGKKKDAETCLSKTLTSISTGAFIEPSPMTVMSILISGCKLLRVRACVYGRMSIIWKC